MLLNEFANKASLALLQKPQLTHMEINFQWNIWFLLQCQGIAEQIQF